MKWSEQSKKLAKWLDEWRLAWSGLMLATREKTFWIAFLITFLIFGTLMNLLASGFAAFNLMAASGFVGALKILGDALLGIFGVHKAFLDWILVFLVAILQGILIGLVALLWKKKKSLNGDTAQNAGLVAGLAVLGSGCPTCGTTLLTPVLGALFSGGGMAIAGAISGIVTAAAILLALLTFKKVGEEVYVIIVSEKWQRKSSKQ